MDNDKELFESAMSDEPIEQVEAATPEPEAQAVEGQARDEQGRFAATQQAEPVAQAEVQPQGRDEAHVPSWRLREEREAREAADRRFAEAQTQWQRQMREMESRLPKQEAQPAPDVFEDPNKFLEHGVRQAIDPVMNTLHYNSRLIAGQVHGKDKVDHACKEFDRMKDSGELHPSEVQQIMNHPNPFAAAVEFVQRRQVLAQVGSDPNAWFERELEKRMADPQFASTQLQKIQSGIRGAPPQSQGNTIRLPPSIGKVPSSHSASDDVADMSDAGLFAHATR